MYWSPVLLMCLSMFMWASLWCTCFLAIGLTHLDLWTQSSGCCGWMLVFLIGDNGPLCCFGLLFRYCFVQKTMLILLIPWEWCQSRWPDDVIMNLKEYKKNKKNNRIDIALVFCFGRAADAFAFFYYLLYNTNVQMLQRIFSPSRFVNVCQPASTVLETMDE